MLLPVSMRRLIRWIPAIAWMTWIFWLSSRETLPPAPGFSYTFSAIAGHFAVFAVLTLLLLFAIDGHREAQPSRLLLVGAIAFLYALSDEVHQAFVPNRNASAFDVIVDSGGIVFALSIWVLGCRKAATW